ncbi:MAG: alpha/beta hydrolase [Glycocaulis sp.]
MITLATLAAGLLLAADTPVPNLLGYPPCSTAEVFDPGEDTNLALRREIALEACRLPLALGAGDVEALLGDDNFAFEVDGEELVIARRGSDLVNGVLNTRLAPVASAEGLFASRFRMAQLNAGLLTFYVISMDGDRISMDASMSWHGPAAPLVPEIDDQRELEGVFMETELWSAALGETRRLRVYLPPGHDPAGNYPAMFFTDGQAGNAARRLEPEILAGRLPAMVLIGVPSGQAGIVEDRSDLAGDLRNADYLPGGSGSLNRFDAHLTFFADELVEHALENWGISPDPALRGVFGFSSGAAFSLQAGFRRPDRFGHAFSMSTGQGPVEDAGTAPDNVARFYFTAGRYESHFMYYARISAAALETAGYDVRFETFSTGHTREADTIMLIPFLRDAFGVD